MFGGPCALCDVVGPRTLSSVATSLPLMGFWVVVSLFEKASYLVDPSSSHMLVSKIKPCMSKYNPLEGETAKGSLNHT